MITSKRVPGPWGGAGPDPGVTMFSLDSVDTGQCWTPGPPCHPKHPRPRDHFPRPPGVSHTSGQLQHSRMRLHQTAGYHHDALEPSGYVRRQSLFSSADNYCNVPPSSDYDPTYASIDEFQQQSSFLHNNNNGWGSLNNTGAEDDYTNNLRSSSYAMLKPSLESGPGVTSHMSGPKSLMPLGHKDHRMPVTSSNTPASLFQSLPYIGNNQPVLSPVSGVSEEVKELEEYARQFEGTGRASRAGARTSGRDSVMTVTSSGQSDSSGDTLRPSPSFTSSPADLRTSYRAGLPSLPPVLASSQHTELRDGAGAVYTKMRPVFHHTTSLNDGRRKSDYYSFSSSQGGFFKPGNGASESPAEPRATEVNCSSLQQSCSVSDRINQMERLTRPAPSHAPAISPVVRTRTPGVTEDEFHLSKSVPNLLSDSTEQAAQADRQKEPAETEQEGQEPSFTYLDPEKKLKVTDNTLKLIQKQAVLDYYTRQKKSSLDLTKEAKKVAHNRSGEESSETGGAEGRESTNSSFDSERGRFLRSVSQGSLSGMSATYQSSESFSLPKQTSSPTGSKHSASHSQAAQQDASYPLDSATNDSSSKTETCGWSPVRGDRLCVPQPSLCPRTPSPDLPPPPQEDDLQEVKDDTPLPPPPPLRIEEEGDKEPGAETPSSKTPRRSPATIAAKGAPGWERFLGVATSSVTFTSDEARKFRRTKDRHRARAHESGPKSLPFAFGKDGLKPLTPAKSSPSLNDKIQSPLGGSGSGAKTWWKTSMDSLRMGGGACTSDPRHQMMASDVSKDQSSVVSHSHSNSDSGLSSLSGRTSCMSPLSVVSTGSSASSGSSRASLRSASIVSGSTIPLDEDDEREAVTTVVRRNQTSYTRTSGDGDTDIITRTAMELFSLTSPDPSLSSLFGNDGHHTRIMAQYLKGVFNWEMESMHDSCQKIEFSSGVAHQADTGTEGAPGQYQLSGVSEKKSQLEGYLKRKISSLRSEEIVFKEREKKNVEVGKFLLKRLQTEARQNEVDKFKLHTEETDKIRSLLLGLASRLARSEIALINLKKNWNEDEEGALKNKREKLLDQLNEARALQASIEKRGSVVTNMLGQYFTQAEFEQFTTFMKTKAMLLLQNKMLSERLSTSQQQLDAVSLHKF